MAWKTSDTAAAIAENSGIAAEQIELALRVIGFQSHTPDLQTVLRRAADLVGRFEALRVPCPGLKEIIDCFILAGRLAEFASTELGSNELRTRYINASADEVFDLREKKRHDLEKDLIAICWIAKVVAHILPVPRSIELNTSELCSLLQMFVLEGKSGATLVEILSPFPFWERLQRLCDILSEEEERAHLRSEFRMLREVLSGLTTVHVPALKISKIQLRNAIQLPLTERALTSAHWHFPRPAELERLQSLVTENNLGESSPTRTEVLIILIALTTGRDISQALATMVSGKNLPNPITNEQYLALRQHIAYRGKPIYAEWHIPIGLPRPLILPLPERLRRPMMRLIPENYEGRLIDFLPPSSVPWETRCNNVLTSLFRSTPRQANLKLRDCLIRQSYEVSGNRGFIQWLWSGRPRGDHQPPRSEQISLSAYLNAQGQAAVETYKIAIRKLIGKFGTTPQQIHYSTAHFGVHRIAHQETAKFLRRQIDNAIESTDLLAQHNTFAAYSLSLLIIATGHRKSNTPFFFPFDLHLEHRLAFIADKCLSGSEARFVPLAPIALAQIDAYIKHLQALATRLKKTNPAVVRHISNLLDSPPRHCKYGSFESFPTQEFGLFFQILSDGSIETIRTGHLDTLFKSAKLDSRIGLFRKAIADYLWDATNNGHQVAALLGHANDLHPFGPASAWTIADWSSEISPIIETYLVEREWIVQESPLSRPTKASKVVVLRGASLLPSNQSYEGRIKERLRAQTRARRAIKAVLSDEFLEDNSYQITEELSETIRERIAQLLNDDAPARNAAATELDKILKIMVRRGGTVKSQFPFIPDLAESPVKISFSRYLSNATAFRKQWVQLVGAPIGGSFDITERLAQFAICLVLFEGVLDPRRIEASINSVIDGTGISAYVDTVSIRAKVETTDHEFDTLTIPGAIGTAFILGLEGALQKTEQSLQPSVAEVLERTEKILRKIFGRNSTVSLTLLCDIFKPWWLIRLPGAIYSTAIGQHNGPCPNRPSETSLFAIEEPGPIALAPITAPNSNRADAIRKACASAHKKITTLLNAAEGYLEKGTAHNRLQRRNLAKQLEAAMTSKATDCGREQPIVEYLISFAHSLIQNGGKKDGPLTFGSIKTYLQSIISTLIEASWDKDISELDYQELNALYCTVAHACRNKRTDWKLALELFHRHIRDSVGAVDIPWLYRRDKQWKKRCRSSLFTSQAIENTVITLSQCNSDTGELTSASLTMLATGLGYGARRSESAGLKATDFDEFDRSHLAIQANVIRDLKSFAGRRAIPAPLIESKKLRESLTQALVRSTSAHNSKPYLLASHQKDLEIQQIQPVIKVIIDVLRSASANGYAVYHDLRRTYATKLIMAGLPLKSRHRGLERARNRLLGSHPPTLENIHLITNSTPKSPYLFNAVGRVLGHADESTLLNVYFLGSPIILADRTMAANIDVTIDDGRLGNILGKDRTAVVKMKQRLKAEHPIVDLGTLNRRYIPICFTEPELRSPPNGNHLLIPSRETRLAIGSPWAWFDQVLCDRKNRSLSLVEAKQTALALGISEEEATIFLNRYEQMLLDTGFSDFEPDNSILLDHPPQRSDGLLRSLKERRAAIRRVSKMASRDKEFRQLLASQISLWKHYVSHRDPWLVCRRLEEFEATLDFLSRIGVREDQLRCETVNTLSPELLQATLKRVPTTIVHTERRFSPSPSNTRANEIGINIGQHAGSKIPDGRDFHRMMALIACLPALQVAV